MKISLVVIRCNDIEISKRFYETLGLTFIKEKHGSGPIHYSSEHEGCVFELYPNEEPSLTDHTRLGFRVENAPDKIKELSVISELPFNGQKTYVIADPDGRKIEITE